ncbi:Ahk1p [Lachancea thermotolerans CBS 6340]|uniref:KLTH0D14762p n=1 Tax=Lachancea thermotolerans (strain ATCC 56472 / CBS 6340 / NRRL Y-8284) TaxID=559295 RepID=C5DFF9_LACTC|nr:KLTH0D14762p [Lachancea thermotolerans CBS 6340]CAR22914.1 KLTH0D14762p [Lachancea thermotolerans CBS 6340]
MEGPKTEARLLHSLNKFIALISHVDSSGQTKAVPNSKLVANFLRLNLLSGLRAAQQASSIVENRETKERDLLVQWWITLLNFLNSKVDNPDEHPSSPLLSIELLSVSLECVSRILTLLIVTSREDAEHKRDLEVYSYHTLLTVHYVTNMLITNTKKRKQLSGNASLHPSQLKAKITYYSDYNALLNAFMGKLMAYAFFFLDPCFNYDYFILAFLEPCIVPAPHSFAAMPWKTKDFHVVQKRPNEQSSVSRSDQNGRIFQVMISYLRNDMVFMAFYWHYWYIALKLLSTVGVNEISAEYIPGCSFLSWYLGKCIDNDLQSFTRYVKSQESDITQHNKIHANHSPVTSEQINNFVFVNFKTIKLWECIRTLIGCVHPALSTLLGSLVSFHDNIQFRKISKIPSHDFLLGNLAYNRILQFIIFQFDTIPQYLNCLDWHKWCHGIMRMLKTLNANCQSVALLALFNIWRFIPSENALKSDMSYLLSVTLWNHLALETHYDVVRILFFKIIVFHLLDSEVDEDGGIKCCILRNLQDAYVRATKLSALVSHEPLLDHSKDSLLFHMNKKLILSSIEFIDEETLMNDIDEAKTSDRRKAILIPSVISVASVRPMVVLGRGKYPFDVQDEMVLKAAKKAATRRREAINANPTPKDSAISRDNRSTSFSSRGTDDSIVDEEDQSNPISNALGSFFSKFGSSSSKSAQKPKSSSSNKLSKVYIQGRQRKNSSQSANSERKNDSDSAEMISMYSSLSAASSVSANKSGSSLELRTQPSNSSMNIGFYRSHPGKEDQGKSLPPQPLKRKKLLAPPEQKFSGEINGRRSVQWMFRLITAPMSGSSSSALSKVQEANDRWGCITARTYDKPLPAPVDSSNTLECGLDLCSLNTSFSEFDLSESEIPNTLQSSSKNHSESPVQNLPYPDFLSLGASTIDSIEGSDSIGRLPVSQWGLDIQTSLASILTEPDEGSQLESHANISNSGANMPGAIIMRQRTELCKLVKLIDVFNCTIKERCNFADMFHEDNAQILMDSEIGTFRSPQFGSKSTVNAHIDFM